MRIGYAKLGRSMPLTLEKCGTLGGDIEMTAALTTLAQRRPHDTFVLVGRNSGDDPRAAGLPSNVVNPWVDWQADFRTFNKRLREEYPGGLTIDAQQKMVKWFDDVTGPAFDDLDQMVMWVGQHGTSNFPIPKVGDRSTLTKPQDWSVYYASFLLRGINRWREVDPWNREEINLNADPRNYHKMRDLKWPLRHPILTQYNFINNIKHERYGDATVPTGWGGTIASNGVWESLARNVYSRIELNALVPGTPSGDLLTYNDQWEDRHHFGIIINEARAIGIKPERSRLTAMHDWVMPIGPHFIHGTWSDKGMASLTDRWGIDRIKSIGWDKYVPILQSVRSTFTTPSSGSGWATTKPWEAFAAGTVCFFHPAYDTQGHILRDAHPDLKAWLLVTTPNELKQRVKVLNESRETWETLIRLQHEHYDRAMKELRYVRMIESRLVS